MGIVALLAVSSLTDLDLENFTTFKLSEFSVIFITERVDNPTEFRSDFFGGQFIEWFFINFRGAHSEHLCHPRS